jgi:DNA mismatch repair protein MutL
MSNRIQLLEETVANRIAAGEVIERPASVVKELVENALDAGADRIDIEVERGGRSLVRVADNGQGMSYDDALLCLERHATSKVRSPEDLLSVKTMGFRGEAIPSIASVCRFRLQTREPDALAGTEIVIDGGKLKSVTETGCAPGTVVEVRSLFRYVPGRRKFLRSESTEWSHVENWIRLFLLAHPGVSFTLRHNAGEVERYPAVGTLKERIGQVYGRDWLGSMLDVDAEEGGYRLAGLVGRPGISRGNRQEQHVFVNGRPVFSRTLNFAILEGYHNSLMKGRFPVVVLFLELDPARVDVNVHPAKREVRFRDDGAVRSFVVSSVGEVLARETSEPIEVTLPAPEQTAPSVAVEGAREAAGAVGQGTFLPGEKVSLAPTARKREEESVPDREAHQPNHDFRILGVMLGLYIIAESENGIVLIDQHAAHERVLFEQMLARVEREDAVSQRLLVPVTVELEPRMAEFVREQQEALNQVGLDVRSMGGNAFIIDGLPPMIKTQAVEPFFRDMVVDLMESGGEVRRKRRLSEEIVAKTVCRHAVKANDPLTLAEAEKLLVDLHACELPYTCPHGRPTMILLSREELEKKFGRVT